MDLRPSGLVGRVRLMDAQTTLREMAAPVQNMVEAGQYATTTDVPTLPRGEEFVRSMVESKLVKLAVMMDVQTMHRMEGSAEGTGQRAIAKRAVMTDALTMSSMEESASGTVQRSRDAAVRDVPIKSRGGESV